MVAKRRLAEISVSLALLGVVANSACDYKPRNQGRVLYEQECASCHMENGQGLGELMPPVAKADYVIEHQDQLACIIRNGMTGKIIVNGVEYDGEMPGNSLLTDVEITNLIHYIIEVLNEKENTQTIVEVREQLSNCSE